MARLRFPDNVSEVSLVAGGEGGSALPSNRFLRDTVNGRDHATHHKLNDRNRPDRLRAPANAFHFRQLANLQAATELTNRGRGRFDKDGDAGTGAVTGEGGGSSILLPARPRPRRGRAGFHRIPVPTKTRPIISRRLAARHRRHTIRSIQATKGLILIHFPTSFVPAFVRTMYRAALSVSV